MAAPRPALLALLALLAALAAAAHLPTSTRQKDDGGLCRINSDCASARCVDATSSSFPPCDNGDDEDPICLCFPRSLLQCSSESDCSDGDDCYDVEIAGVKRSLCLDEALAAALRVSERVCVDAAALAHLADDQLVFPRPHPVARVLCDAARSCATPGHIVRYSGKGMMMKTYCQLVGGCQEELMQVNSPKYRPGLRVPSNTEGMHFTAFAARYETLAEETAMAAMVRAGL